ncbi:uroporphyrinogen-III synthase [Paraliobacillus sediminis]|uniref:uroporphyrinogen-III synthase n=1 Tax=Paraliobacillus sediminis TaxID=1885916 RepID=UPI000E3C61AC|nr:uroporphyrinogen-III synthase [Paraliobacillus sediminis]
MIAPLQGKTILVTRAEEHGEIFSKQLENEGAKVIHIPLLTFQLHKSSSTHRLLKSMEDFKWIFFTSANGVIYFFEQLVRYNINESVLKGLQFAVVGKKTEQMLQSYGYEAAFYPTHYHGEAMAEEFVAHFGSDEKVLLVVGNRSPLEVKAVLEKSQVYIDYVIVYDTVVNRDNQTELIKRIKHNEIDGYTFTSPSTVEAFDEQLESVQAELVRIKQNRLCVCIGTTTAKTAKINGFKKIRLPQEFTTEKMVIEIVDFFSQEREGEDNERT